jgi:short-subunit dehydrogenase
MSYIVVYMTFETLSCKRIFCRGPALTARDKENIVTNKTSKGTALITGSSSGIGALYADRLAKRGYDLILVARNEERLNAVATRLRSETGAAVKILPADLGDKADLDKVEAVLRDDPTITMLINNAGVGSVASILQADVEKMGAMIDLNVLALTRLTYAVAPAFAARGTGTIVNVASVVGIAVEMLNGVYSASKSYVLSFGHSLQKDLADKGVRVQTVLPGATATEFWDIAGYAPQKTSSTTMSAEDAVDAALAGLDAGEQVTIPGLHDADAWTRWEADRREISQKFGNAEPAPRYGLPVKAA